MKDEERLCQCGQKHKWGITGRDQGGVVVYGPKPVPDCQYFRPATDQLPEFVGDLRELWSQTGDLDAQATLATRVVIARLRSLDPVAQWPEFVGYVISQLTNLRGAMLREDAKMARLVASADEFIEATGALRLLSERVKKQDEMLSQISDQLTDMQLAQMGDGEDEALRHFGLIEPDESGFVSSRWTPSQPEEPVLVEKVRDDDESEQNGDQDSDENGNGEDDEEET